MKKGENIFSLDAVKRQQEQERMEKKLAQDTAEPVSSRKVPINLTLPPEYKERLIKYSKEKHLSASILLQMWIDEHCK